MGELMRTCTVTRVGKLVSLSNSEPIYSHYCLTIVINILRIEFMIQSTQLSAIKSHSVDLVFSCGERLAMYALPARVARFVGNLFRRPKLRCGHIPWVNNGWAWPSLNSFWPSPACKAWFPSPGGGHAAWKHSLNPLDTHSRPHEDNCR